MAVAVKVEPTTEAKEAEAAREKEEIKTRTASKFSTLTAAFKVVGKAAKAKVDETKKVEDAKKKKEEDDIALAVTMAKVAAKAKAAAEKAKGETEAKAAEAKAAVKAVSTTPATPPATAKVAAEAEAKAETNKKNQQNEAAPRGDTQAAVAKSIETDLNVKASM